jgi:hypothetical protein
MLAFVRLTLSEPHDQSDKFRRGRRQAVVKPPAGQTASDVRGELAAGMKTGMQTQLSPPASNDWGMYASVGGKLE